MFYMGKLAGNRYQTVLCKGGLRGNNNPTDRFFNSSVAKLRELRLGQQGYDSSLIYPCVASLAATDKGDICCMPVLTHFHAARLLATELTSDAEAIAALAVTANPFGMTDIKCSFFMWNGSGCATLCCGRLQGIYDKITHSSAPQQIEDRLPLFLYAGAGVPSFVWPSRQMRRHASSTPAPCALQSTDGGPLRVALPHMLQADGDLLVSHWFSTDFSLVVSLFNVTGWPTPFAHDSHCVLRTCQRPHSYESIIICFDLLDYLHHKRRPRVAQHSEAAGLAEGLRSLLVALKIANG